MEHLDLVSNTFLKKRKENLELLGQRLSKSLKRKAKSYGACQKNTGAHSEPTVATL